MTILVELEFFKSMPEGIRKDAWFLTKVTMTGQERNPETGRYPLLNWDDPATNQKHPLLEEKYRKFRLGI